MKAGFNGILNLSILDGWYDEAYEQSGGWAIGDREPYADDQDEIHARAIYSLLENEIVPMYYDRGPDGIPSEWMRRVRQSIEFISRQYNCQRMVAEYASQLYDPAHLAWSAALASGFGHIRRGDGTQVRVLERVRIVTPHTADGRSQRAASSCRGGRFGLRPRLVEAFVEGRRGGPTRGECWSCAVDTRGLHLRRLLPGKGDRLRGARHAESLRRSSDPAVPRTAEVGLHCAPADFLTNL
jgi:hypothetical protein